MKKAVLTMMVILGMTFGTMGAHGDNHRLAGDIVLGIGALLGGPKVVVTTPPPAPVVTTPVVVQQPVVTQPIVTTPVVTQPVVTTPVVTTPVVTTPVVTAPTTISYGYYNNVYCPTYNGYYYYGNSWVWGGGFGPRPAIPMWHPPMGHPMPIGPRPPMGGGHPPMHGGPRR